MFWCLQHPVLVLFWGVPGEAISRRLPESGPLPLFAFSKCYGLASFAKPPHPDLGLWGLLWLLGTLLGLGVWASEGSGSQFCNFGLWSQFWILGANFGLRNQIWLREQILGFGGLFWALEPTLAKMSSGNQFGLGEPILGFGNNFRLWGPILGFAANFLGIGFWTVEGNFGLCNFGLREPIWAPEANFGLGEQILGFGAQPILGFGLWKPILGFGNLGQSTIFGLWELCKPIVTRFGRQFLALGASLGFGSLFWAVFWLWKLILGFGANFELWEQIWALEAMLGFGSHFGTLGAQFWALGANFRLWPSLGFGKPLEANLAFWKPILGFGRRFGLGLPGPRKAPEV